MYKGNEEMTESEKANLLGLYDMLHRDEIDLVLMEVMVKTPIPHVDEVDPVIRRTLYNFCVNKVDQFMKNPMVKMMQEEPMLQTLFTLAFLHGYSVALAYNKPLTKPLEAPPEKAKV